MILCFCVVSLPSRQVEFIGDLAQFEATMVDPKSNPSRAEWRTTEFQFQAIAMQASIAASRRASCVAPSFAAAATRRSIGWPLVNFTGAQTVASRVDRVGGPSVCESADEASVGGRVVL